ncbi:MAG: ExeM/NucH family extracellular endonuclease [Pseudomarimonas sp.]
MTSDREPGDAQEGPATLGALQGAGARSPFENREVAVHGVVTGNFVAGLDGFFMQDGAGADDGDPATSDAVFVQWKRDRTPKVRRGDRLRVMGKVVELGEAEQTVTAIAADKVEVLGRGGVNVTTINAGPASSSEWERHESMWLRVDAPLTVTGNGGLIRFGEVEVAFGGRLFQPTERHPPGPKADALAADNQARMLVLDDNRRGEFPDKLWFLEAGLTHDAPMRVGSTLADVEGVLNHAHGRWRLQLTDELRVAVQSPRPKPLKPPPGLRIASVNLENFFNGNGRKAGFPTPRGATSLKEFERQTSKTVALLVGLSADILAVSELENDGNDARSAEAALLAALNAGLGEGGDYRSVMAAEGGSGRDQIRVGIFYRESRVRPLGNAVAINEAPFAEGGSRPPLAQAFSALEGGEPFVVVANHFKSKGSCPTPEQPAAPGDSDKDDFQSCWNATRVASAQRLHDWLQTDPTGQGVARIVLLGDFNSYAQEDPLRLLRQLGWRDVFEVAGAGEVYSYVYAGQAGRLDHALVTAALAPAVSGAAIWHTNADEAEAFHYQTSQRNPAWQGAEPWRTSDHDPLLIGLDFSRP